jgi:hypothetical protein
MPLLTKELSLFLSSSANAGATDISLDGSKFSVSLDTPIRIPSNALDCTLSVIQANIWNVSPNISLALGNNLFRFTTSSPANPGVHTLTISDGLYSLSDLNSFVSVGLLNLGLPSNLFVISGIGSTGQASIGFLILGDSVQFNIAGTIRTVLGFDSANYTSILAGETIYSQDVANFNLNNSYLILCDLVSGGIPLNSLSPNIIASVPIDVSPGSQIVYTPFNATEVDAMTLIGLSKNNITVRIVNQDLAATSTQNETYSILVRIKYTVRI